MEESPYTRIILKSGKHVSVKRFHPWVFSGAIKKIKGPVQEGDIVEVWSNQDEYLGTGFYQIGAITVRIFSFKQIVPDYSFWENAFLKAYKHRQELGLVNNTETNVYRLIHAEGDHLPGLIIDYYHGTLVMQCYAIGMYYLRDTFVEIIKSIYGQELQAIYDKSSSTLPYKGPVDAKDEYLFGGPGEKEIQEHQLKFLVDWENGQKTGFFLDQRENRELLKKYSSDKKVLNMFGYTGGFSVYAIAGGAKRADTVDSSRPAIKLTDKNIELNNQSEKHQSFTTDAFEFLKSTEEEYDVIILDPPAFAKHQKVLPNAIQGYKKLNALGIEKVKAGGILFTFSCSQALSKAEFRKTVLTAAINSGRKVSVLHQLGQPPDHPINIFHPESEYLKGLVLKID